MMSIPLATSFPRQTMNRIFLAYCHDNAGLAETVEQSLGRIGIPFEHIHDRPDDNPGDFFNRLQGAEDPAILFVTDNFFKSKLCMSGALPAMQALLRDKRLLVVVADGRVSHDNGATFVPVETHFDRMVYALQYMNFWQNAWLELSDRYQHAAGEAKSALEHDLNTTRNIANETGELIGVLRESGYITWQQFSHDDFALFFRQYGLSEWHTQYRQLAHASYIPLDATPPIPETAPHRELAGMPVVAGGLIPEPAEIEVAGQAGTDTPDWVEADLDFGSNPISAEKTATVNGHFRLTDSLIQEVEKEEDETEQLDAGFAVADAHFADTDFEMPEPEQPDPHAVEAQIDQAIRDAWFWLDKGHTERGLELLQFTAEQNPENERARTELDMARAKFQAPETAAAEQPEVQAQNPSERDAEAPPAAPEAQAAVDNEAKSYELMGDMAAEKGDYLFAKYCWDRAAEIDAHHPDIFRKLGLMTSEHLRDYRETAVHYLNKALEQNPNDADVHLALAGSIIQNEDPALAEAHYTQAVMLNPALRTPENDRLFRPAFTAGTTVATGDATQSETPAATTPAPQPVLEKRDVLTVLVTGATSGIGRATAEIFARNGHRVILTGRRVERLVLLKTQFEEELHADVLMLPFDVREQGAVQAALDNLPESWQNIDILVNNAGLAKGLAPIQEGNLDHWEQMIDTNIKGVLYVTRAVTPGMVARRRGHVINISSSAGKEVYLNGNVYCATKFAIEALTKAMRLDLHSHNIRVSQVSPGHVEETEFAITRFDGDAERARIYNDFQPLKSSDVAEAIYWMATRPPHVNVQDIQLFSTQQASATVVDRSGRD